MLQTQANTYYTRDAMLFHPSSELRRVLPARGTFLDWNEIMTTSFRRRPYL